MNTTPEQAKAALSIANETRIGRAKLKQAVKSGQQSLPDLIDPDVETPFDKYAARMRISELIEAAPRVGPARCRTILWRFGLNLQSGVSLSILSNYRRAELAKLLRARGIGK